MKRKNWYDFHDESEYEVYINELVAALTPFAEKPSEQMDNYPCHNGITTKEKCGRCGRAIRAYQAIVGETD